jgi:hypothetical protein
MGGVLARSEAPPRFLVQATQDPMSAPLERIQIVKGWLASDGDTRKRVCDVAWAGDRALHASGSLPPVVAGDGEAPGFEGAASLSAVWSAPEFEASQPAFYYVRMLEIPTPRHSKFDAMALGIAPAEAGHPEMIQERVYG